MIRSYIRLALFGLGLLVGVQVPGFMLDYAQHVEARRLEAQEALRGFEDTAQRFFGGDLQTLVQHYANSRDPVIQNDAQSLDRLVLRTRLLDRESRAMQGPWFAKAWHLVFRADRQLLQSTWRTYSFQVILSPGAIAWGLVCALLLAWIAESLWLLIRRPFRRRQQRGDSAPQRRDKTAHT